MLTTFLKMHGAGNDFLVIDARAKPPPLTQARIRALADRRTGIGWDQLITLHEPTNPAADAAMEIHNPDGTPAGACGNATRCIATLLTAQLHRPNTTIQTEAGLLPARCLPDGRVEVDMGPPALNWAQIPLAQACDTLYLPLPGNPAAASMGNPHATLFVHDIETIDPSALGPALEHHPMFPERANIGFAQILPDGAIRLRVWERGAGLTRACGSGACAALVNANRRGLAPRQAALHLDGGTLTIHWREADDHVLMTGPAATAFHGSVDLSTYPA